MAASSPSSSRSRSLHPGGSLGPYTIIECLGVGGMGEVYLARDSKLGREVAIKVLPPSPRGSGELQIARFEREARMLAAINHPNIAAIYDIAEWNNVQFLVLEFIPGRTLSDRIGSGAVPWREAIRIGRQIAEALGAAHAKGIMHRDLKPQNIMITPDGLVKILDFGLAKGSRPEAGSAGRLESPTLSGLDAAESPTLENFETTPGTILGTPTYMSPEQARGQTVDHRTDIWAFGCVLFEMLSGKKAFDGETITDRIAAVIAGEPPWVQIPEGLPERIKELLRRCLTKNVGERLPDMSTAGAWMEEALLSSAPEKGGQSAKVRLPGKAILYGLLSLVLLLFLATAGYFWVSRPNPAGSFLPDQKFLVVLPFKNLGNQESGQLGEGMVAVLSARLGQTGGIQIVMPSDAFKVSDREEDPFLAARDVGANLLVGGSVQRSGDRIRVTYSLWNVKLKREIRGNAIDGNASDLFGIQDRLADEVTSSLHISFAPGQAARKPAGLESALAQEQYIKAMGYLQRYDRETSVDQAIELLKGLSAEKPDAAMIWAALGRGYLVKYNKTRDRKWVELADSACARARKLDPDFPDVGVTIGELRLAAGQAEEAVASFRKTLEVQPGHYAATLGLANSYAAAGSRTEAEKTFQRAIGLQPAYWAGYSKLAAFYYNSGNYPRAAEMFRRVTELSPDNAVAFANLGSTEQLMGDFSQALVSHRKSLELQPTALAYSNIGTLEFYSNHFEEAAEAFESATRLSPDHYQMWANLGDAYRWTKNGQKKAADAYARATILCLGELKVNPKSARVLMVLALCRAKTGNSKEAEMYARKALLLEANPEFYFNAAIIAHIAQNNELVFDWLKTAARKGYPRIYLARDPELANLRGNPAFQELLNEKLNP